jgi:glutamate racemase
MTTRPLLFYDSGAGGLPYLTDARARLPGQRYIYLADRESFPLGEKPAELVRSLVLSSVSRAIGRFDPGMVVIACNTASVIALQMLRERFSIPFVGVVPAVKPAALNTARGKLAVVATSRTVSGPYLDSLIREFADGREVIRIPVADLVEFAEYSYLSADGAARLAAVRRALSPLLEQEVGAVILGCTHFVLLEKEFRRILSDRVALIDSREGVTRRIVSLLSEGEVGPGDAWQGHRGGTGDLYIHGGAEDQERYRAFAAHFALSYCGLLEDRNP